MKLDANYTDEKGSIEGYLDWDERKFTLHLEGAQFVSEDLTSFQRFNGGANQRIAVDGFNRLVNCELQICFPVAFELKGIRSESLFKLTMIVGSHYEKDYRITSQVLELNEVRVESDEMAIVDMDKLESSLLPDTKLKGCFNCAFAGSNVFGNSFYGRLSCFRKIKSEFLKVTDKEGFVDLLNDAENPVHQLFLCDEYEKRTKQSWV